MRLRDRLARLSSPAATTPAAGAEPIDDRAARIAQLRDLIGQVAAREARVRARVERPAGDDVVLDWDDADAYLAARASHPTASPPSLPLGTLQEGPHGPLRVLERWLEPQHCHGRAPLRDALRVLPEHLAALAHDRALGAVRPRDLLILDTETTGLSGGTGTVPFLIGLAWFEDGECDGTGHADGADCGDGGEPVLRVEQLFLENLGGEAPLLHRLAERIARAGLLVTYNGKAFDWPLLRTRFVLSRLPLPALPPHLDLLHCSRRLWSGRLPSVRLTEVERSVLGKFRQDDVDGSEIPAMYLRYLRGGDPRLLEPVLQHNEHDVVALAALLGRVARIYGDGEVSHAHDLHACALLALRARDAERAMRFAQRAIDEAEDPALRTRALLLCGRLHTRVGERAAAIARYQELLEHTATARCAQSAEHTAAAHLALSRLHERLRDLPRAYAHARASEPAEGPVAHARRLGRLRRRFLDAAR
jgi:uncharacterized protein YprB with RNaseH-like and TPR domain